MWELYWISRLTTINHMMIVVLIVGVIVAIVSAVTRSEASSYLKHWTTDSNYKETLSELKGATKALKISLVACIISIIGIMFVPTTREALLIWGVGGTIDYIKENPTAKQIPDKCVKALDKWVDSFTKEDKDSIK